jgi:hypothetical protein
VKVIGWRLKAKTLSDPNEFLRKPEAVRIRLLGGFQVTVGARTLEESG